MTVTGSGAVDALRAQIARVRSLHFADLPEPTRAAAHHSLLDWLGCAVAGSTEEAVTAVETALDPGDGTAIVVGLATPRHWRDAIVMNGVRGHALDFDDMLPELQGHPSAAVFPALFVLGQQGEQTVGDILAAYVAGVEIAVWLARRVMPQHYDAGWHGTGTMGVFAAAAGAAALEGASEDAWISALDFSATQSAGLRALFGTPAKPLHAARAAEAGAFAARLAAAGATSLGQGLFGERGFLALYGAGKTGPIAAPEHEWAVDGTLYKAYASCYMTQSVVDGAVELAAALRGEAVESLVVSVSPKLRDVCGIEDPQTGTEAKFSIHATAALGLLGRDLAAESTFVPGTLADEDYRALRARITVDYDDALAGSEPRSRMRLVSTSGRVLTTERDRGVPESDIAARRHTLVDKTTALAQPLLGTVGAAALVERAMDPQVAMRDLAAVCSTVAC